jgi:hypothetical protein
MDYYVTTPRGIRKRAKAALGCGAAAVLAYAGIIFVPPTVNQVRVSWARPLIREAISKQEYTGALKRLDDLKGIPLIYPSARDELDAETRSTVDECATLPIGQAHARHDYSEAVRLLAQHGRALTPGARENWARIVATCHPDRLVEKARTLNDELRFELLDAAVREYTDIGTPKPELEPDVIAAGIAALRTIPSGEDRFRPHLEGIIRRAAALPMPMKLPEKLQKEFDNPLLRAALSMPLRQNITADVSLVPAALANLSMDAAPYLDYCIHVLATVATGVVPPPATGILRAWERIYALLSRHAPQLRAKAIDALLDIGTDRADEGLVLAGLRYTDELQGPERSGLRAAVGKAYVTLAERASNGGSPNGLTAAYRMLHTAHSLYTEAGIPATDPKLRGITELSDKVSALLKQGK